MLQPIHRWLTDLEHTACGLGRTRGRRRPLVVRGWPDVTCQRCLGSIHAHLARLLRQPPGSPGEPQGHPHRDREDPHRRAAAMLPVPARWRQRGTMS